MNYPYSLRFEHCYIPGRTGHGKTTILQRMALQDIQNGAGVTFIDPGDAVKELLNYIPDHRKDDCIYLDFKNVIPFRILNFDKTNPLEKDELAKDVTFLLLKGIQNAPAAENYIQRLCYTLLDCTIPVCLLDAYFFLTKTPAPWGNGGSRYDEILAAVPETWRTRWQHDFPKEERRATILLRLEPLVNNSIMLKLFGTLKPELDIAAAMNSRKILLVDLGGAGTAKMEYGSLLFAKMKQEVFKRADLHKLKRIPHFLFIDEFETFSNPESFADTLKMARKYRLSLTLASLTFQELDPKLRSAIGIISSYILFRLNHEDVSYFKNLVPLEDSKPIIDLDKILKHHALYCLGASTRFQPTKPLDFPITMNAEYIRKRTVAKYAGHSNTMPHTESNEGDDIKPTRTVLPHAPEAGGTS